MPSPSNVTSPEPVELIVAPGARPIPAEIAHAEAGTVTVVLDGHPFRVTMLHRGEPHLLLVDGVPFEALAQAGVAALGAHAGSLAERDARNKAALHRATPGVRDVVSPMPGRVVKVHCEAGNEVAAGQPLLVLEAMKMENELVAPVPGIVDQLLVGQGDAIEAGVTLVRLRTPDAPSGAQEAG